MDTRVCPWDDRDVAWLLALFRAGLEWNTFETIVSDLCRHIYIVDREIDR